MNTQPRLTTAEVCAAYEAQITASRSQLAALREKLDDAERTIEVQDMIILGMQRQLAAGDR